MDNNPYSNSGKRWSNDEDEQIIQLYNVEMLDIGDICKRHKRFIGGITSRLKGKNIITNATEVRGYEDFIQSDEYREMKNYKKIYNDEKKKTENNYEELKEGITELKSELSEIKTMIKRLAIYDFD